MLPYYEGVPQVDHTVQQHTDADEGDENLRRLERIEQNNDAKGDHQHRQHQQNAPLLVTVLFDINGCLQLHNAIKDKVQSQNKGKNGGKQLRLNKEADAQCQRYNTDHQRKGGIALLAMGNEAVHLPQTIGSGYATQYIAENIDGSCGPHNQCNAQCYIANCGKNKVQYKFFRHSRKPPCQ